MQGELDSQIRLERYDGYWGGTPALQTVVFRMMPEPSTRIAALLAGEVHIIHAVPPDLVDRINSVPGVSVHTGLGTRAAQIELNNRVPPFDDQRVRQALNYAVDWDSILDNIYQGYADRLATPFLPSGFGFAEVRRFLGKIRIAPRRVASPWRNARCCRRRLRGCATTLSAPSSGATPGSLS